MITAHGRRASAAASLLAGLLLSGCVGYRITPEPLKAPPHGQLPPLPLRVAVVEGGDGLKPGFWKRTWLREGDARKLTEGLRYSGLFSVVEGVESAPATSAYDLVVSWKLDIAYHVGLFPFLPLCDPLIIGCGLDNTDTANTKVDAFVANGAGAGLKDYHQAQDTTLVYKLFSTGKREAARASSIERAVAQIVTAFLEDREFYRGLAAKDSRPAEAPAPVAAAAPSAAVPGTAAYEAVKADAEKAQAELAAEEAKSAAVPAPPSAAAPEAAAPPAPAAAPEPPAPAEHVAAKPEPVRRGPMTRDEEKEIDEQVMP